jgi:CBS domain-containing protein
MAAAGILFAFKGGRREVVGDGNTTMDNYRDKAPSSRRPPMQVKEAMTRGVECVRSTDSIATAAQKMKELDVGALPVCGDDDRVVGMITDRDITTRATAGCCDPGGTYIRDIMTPSIIYVFEDQDVGEAAQLMKENQIRRLVVLNQDKRLSGIVSLGDLAVDARDEELVGATLEAVSAPAEPRR